MPVVTLPKMITESALNTTEWVEVRVQSRKDQDIYRELALLFPPLHNLLVRDGEPRWVFALFRERDDEDLRYDPDHTLEADDRLYLVPMVGC